MPVIGPKYSSPPPPAPPRKGLEAGIAEMPSMIPYLAQVSKCMVAFWDGQQQTSYREPGEYAGQLFFKNDRDATQAIRELAGRGLVGRLFKRQDDSTKYPWKGKDSFTVEASFSADRRPRLAGEPWSAPTAQFSWQVPAGYGAATSGTSRPKPTSASLAAFLDKNAVKLPAAGGDGRIQTS